MRNFSNILLTPTLLIMALFASCNNSKPDKNGVDTLNLHWTKLGELPPGSNQDQATPNPGLAGPVAGISNGYLVVGGGSNFPKGLPWEGGRKAYHRKLYIYQLLNKENGDSAILSPALGELPYSIGYPACVSTAAGIVVAGGENETGPLSTVELIHIDKSQLEPQLTITSLPSLPVACSGAMIAAIGSKVYLAGGNNANGHTLGQFLLLDLTDTAKGWQPLPKLVQPTSFGVLCADQHSHTIYLAGGRKSNIQARTTFYASLFAFNTDNQNWSKKANLPYSVSAATGITMQGKLLFFGGDQGETFHQTEDLLLKIAVAKDSTEKRQLTLQKNILQQHHPGFTRQILAYNPALDQWKPSGKLSFASQVTTTAIAWQKGVIIPCGEIRAGIRYANIIEGTINSAP